MYQSNANACEKVCQELGWPLPVHVGRGIMVSINTVTPDLAQTILDRFHIENNRKKKHTRIPIYSRDMMRERWAVTHQGLAFDNTGRLFDGQNRLYACIDAGVPFETMVVWGLNGHALINTDSGVVRGIVDAARVAGLSIQHRVAGTIRRMVLGGEGAGCLNQKLSNEDALEAAVTMKEPLDFIEAQFPSHVRGITIQGVLGAIGRAWYYEPHDRLAEFCECLKTGVVRLEGDSAASMLSRFLLANIGQAAGRGYQLETFSKTQNAIKHFCERKGLSKLYAASEDLYPLPKAVRAKLALID